MEADFFHGWDKILAEMLDDDALLTQVAAENEWFTPPMVRRNLIALRPWMDIDALRRLREGYPPVNSPRRVGIIMAGNVPLVGLHDLMMVLLSGHHAVVKPSHKDRILLSHLLHRASDEARARVTLVPALDRQAIDFLIATGSDTAARHIAMTFSGLPHVIRKNRFSVAVLQGGESRAALEALALDILDFHGMGCRSVSNLLVPKGYDCKLLAAALDACLPADALAPAWADVQRHARALHGLLGQSLSDCRHMVLVRAKQLRPAPVGVLHVVEVPDAAAAEAMIAAAQADLQVVSGAGHAPLGCAQSPTLTDWADGVDTLELLTNLAI